MDEGLYNNILGALEAVHGAHTSNEDRQVAGSMLEGFKDRPDGMPYALYILQTPSPKHTDQVRHFALHSLERMLKLRWRPVRDVKRKNGSRNGAGNAEAEPAPNPGDPPPLSLAEKEQLKECMIQVMARGTRDVSQEAQFIKIKVADLVAQLAERDYPQRWEDFLDQMMQAWTTGPTQAELAMMVLARLIEDCHDLDFRSEIDFSRRDPILRGINEFLPRLMPTLYNFLVQQWQAYQAAGAGNGATEGLLINRGLTLLSKILPWVGESHMSAESHDFLPAMAQLSNARVARSEALVCLEAMCSQKLSNTHFMRLLEHLPQIVSDVKQALAQESVPLSESLEVHQMLSACLEETIIRNISFIVAEKEFQNRTSQKSEFLSKFLEQLLALTRMPSKRMAGNLLQAWQVLANKPSIREIPVFVVLAPQLLAAFSMHTVTVRFEDDVTDDVVAAEEFVDEEDYFQFITLFKAQVKILQLQLAKLDPLHTVQYISEQAQAVLQHHAVAVDNLDARGLPTWKSEASTAWSTFAALAKGTVVGLPHWCTGDKPSNPDERMEGGTAGFISVQCFQMLRNMVDAVMKWNPIGSILIGSQLTVLESCRRLFSNESSMLQIMFDKLFTLLEAPDPSINLAAMPNVTTVIASPEVESVRQAASRTLVSLATDVSSVLVVALGGLCQRVNNVLNTNRPSLAVRTNLLELLVVVSNSVKDDEQRKTFVLDMLKEPMSVWTGKDVTEAVSSPETFLSRLGITPDLPADEAAYAPTAPRTVQATTAFQTLRAPLTVLYGLAQRVSVEDDKSFRGNLDAMVRAGLPGLSAVNPVAAAWTQALPNIINMIRCVHLLWASPTRQQLLSHPIARATLAMIPSQESEQNRRKNKSGDYEVTPQDLQNLTLVAQWCRMLHDLRTVCYNLLGLACRQGVLYVAVTPDQVQDVIINGLLAGLEYVENRHLPGLCVRFLEKYVVYCPPSLLGSHLEPVMTAFTKTLMPRLSAAWSPESAGAQTLRQRNPELFQVYAHGGAMLTQEDLDADDLEDLKTKHRESLTRALAEFIQTCLGLRGELHVSEAPGQSGRSTNNSSNNSRDNRGYSRGGKSTSQRGQTDKVVESKKIRRKRVVDVLIRGDTPIPPSILMFTVGLIRHWGDNQACRKALQIASAIHDEYDVRNDMMRQKLSRDLFRGTVDALVEGAQHLRGMEWEAIVLVTNLYRAFALTGTGSRTQSGRGRGPDETLRQKLLSMPGVQESDVVGMEDVLTDPGSEVRSRKEAMRDVLRRATTVVSAAQGTTESSSNFWKENRSQGGGKGQGKSSRNRNRNNNYNNDKDYTDRNSGDPSSDLLWQQSRRR